MRLIELMRNAKMSEVKDFILVAVKVAEKFEVETNY